MMNFFSRLLFVAALVAASLATAMAQPRYDMQRLSREKLNRGVVALRTGGRVFVSWRTLSSDTIHQAFDVYRNGQRLNDRPLSEGGTCFVDEHPLDADAVYEVRGGQCDGAFELKAGAPEGYLPIAIDRPEGGVAPDGFRYDYHANDASVGDVDGDGQYEIFLKWDPSNAKDNMFAGFTGKVLIDCYRLDGTRLWRVDLGRNIRAGAHFTQFMVYDFDGDGRAEMMVKTADGTVDGCGTVIGDSAADWRHGIANANGQRIARDDNKTGRIMDGPEYISVFNGLTGAVMDTKPYIPERGNLRDWGDDHANRSDRYLAAVGYLDGRRASAIFCRGYYTRTVIVAWDWNGTSLTARWAFDTNNPEWASYAGQGNHNIRVADVDADGCDEITYGSMALDHDGRGLYNTGFGHGDAMHLTAFDPTTDRLQVWDCHENRRDGSDFRDARTGEVIFQIKSPTDVGRCMAADIDPTNPGLEMWSSESGGLRDIKGNLVKPRQAAEGAEDPGDNTALRVRGVRIPTNFGIWWDGDLLREMLDRETISKYDWTTGRMNVVQRLEGVKFNNGTKSNPCLSADLLGDWREEVLARNAESTELRLYVTTIPTDHRINCLMEDIPYRLSVAAQNTAYNQPPQPGFYLGPDPTVRPFLK